MTFSVVRSLTKVQPDKLARLVVAIAVLTMCDRAVVNHFGLVAELLACADASAPPQTALTTEKHLCISGVYPHLATHNQPDDVADRPNHGECGIGAIVPWAGRLWYLTYPQHKTTGSNDKLYEVDAQMNRTVRPESVGGTHACRMIHRESNQLIIGPYFVDANGNVRSADLKKLRGRMTAIMRHLTDPTNKVYFFDMEGAIYEVEVHTLEVTKLFSKPVPGWHGKGGYTAQRRIVIANNGESGSKAAYKDVLAGGPAKGDEAGVLAEWDGKDWRLIERKQFCDVTGPGGIYGNPDDTSVLWAIGWDKRSVILKLLDHGQWFTFRLPKASHTFDPIHGWFTEWPRIREIAPGRPMMCMHGSLLDFPIGFCAKDTSGIRPISTHLRFIPDFGHWNGRVILGANDSSMMDNPMCGQGQSNLWFGKADDLKRFGPQAGWGGVWLGDAVVAGVASDPFLMAGYRQRCLHLAVGASAEESSPVARCTDKGWIKELPRELQDTVRVTITRGDYHQPTPGYSFTVDRDVVVYLAVDDRGGPELDGGWRKTDWKLTWDSDTDSVYVKSFAKGRVEIPGHQVPHKPDAYALPNLCFVRAASGTTTELLVADVTEGLMAQISRPVVPKPPQTGTGVMFTVELDRKGDGTWSVYKTIHVPASGYAFHVFPDDLEAEWLRLKSDQDCQATAYLHYGAPRQTLASEARIFDSLAEAQSARSYMAGLIRPAEHNRSLQWLRIAVSPDGKPSDEEYLEIELQGTTTFAFAKPEAGRADQVRKIAEVTRDFEVDDASVIVTDKKGNRYRLPKGCAAFDRPFPTGWPRAVRECVSERYLANIHGSFYEIPRSGHEAFPDFERMKPVCSHNKRIADFCTWRGLLVMSGTRNGARPDGQFFPGADGHGLWFGVIDDLWRLGKPVGRGGPWRDTPVTAGQPSDPYLMNGYDRKRLEVSHNAGTEIRFTVEVNFDHTGFRKYEEIPVPAGKTVTHAFPDGFHAHWVRLRTDKDCTATAVFTYE